MEYVILGVFCAGLLLCLALHASILFALIFGWFLFAFYGKRRGFG